jgi:hypothetical protein
VLARASAAAPAWAQLGPPGPYPPDYAPPEYDYPPPGHGYPPPNYGYPPPAELPPPAAAAPSAPTPPPGAEATAPAPPANAAARPFSLGVRWSTAIIGENDSTSVVNAPWLDGAYAVHPRLLIALGLGFGWLVDNQGLAESTFRAGNPQLSGHYRATWGPWRVQAGLGVTAPLATIPLGSDGRLYAFLYNRTLATAGMWNQWLWQPGRMAVPAFLRASYTLASGLTFVLEHADALVFGVRNGQSGTYFVGQLALEALVPIGAGFALCPRLQTVLLPSTGVDRWQSAAGLRGTLTTGLGRFFLGFLANLDEPIAAQAGLARWGFHLGKEIDL